jgi:hypothetical protein
MNRFVFGRGWVFQDETNGEGSDLGGGAPAGDGGGEGGGAPEGGDGAGEADGAAPAAGGEKKEEAPADMKAAIDAGLGYKKGPGGEALDPLTGKVKEEPAKPAAKPAEGKETETHHANGTPKKNDKGEALDDKGQVAKPAAAPKLKSAAELDLKPEEKKGLHAKTQARFAEVIGALKTHEGMIAKQNDTIKTLGEARDAILGVLEETHTSQEQLSAYLEFNALLQSKDPKDWESALQMVEGQRAALYKALGREPEGGGLDLLADFPDLKKQVDEEEITRAAALEIAKGRRDRAARDAETQRQQQHQHAQQQTAAQRKQAAETALTEIERWTAGLSKTDLDYKAKEDKLLAKIDGVLKNYPPNQWLPTLKLLYEGIEIQKTDTGGSRQERPLRPSGAVPGAKAPNSMLDAINQGLGYAGAEKG